MSTGERSKQLRKNVGFTQEQLATKIGISKSEISLIEKNKRSLSLPILCSIATNLNTTTDYLLGRTDNPDFIINSNIPYDLRKKLEFIIHQYHKNKH